jgi:DNA polymerase-3 subunit epsilon
LKVHPNGKEETYTKRVNPTVPIPPEVTLVHGISDEDIADAPTFKDISKEVYQMIKDCDLGGFNSNRFDIPVLAEEMLRSEVDFDMKNMQSIDVQTIFHKMEQRTLSAAYKFYCDKNLEDAHSAEADTLATYEVLKAQLDRYAELENDSNFLAEFSSRKKFADFAGFIIYNKEGIECFSFGKHKGKLVTEVLDKEPGYFGWLLNADFPLYTKKVLTAIKLRAFNNKLS